MGDHTHKKLRINIQLGVELKKELEECSRLTGESVSAFCRRGAIDRIRRIRDEQRDNRLKEAYIEMGDENRKISRDFEAIDLEGWE